MAEFTGERVIPGQVETDLWNEHFSRYAFASEVVGGKRVLDLGCGSGYGSAELARSAASVVGVDVSSDAISYARVEYTATNLSFALHSCTDLPFSAGSFDIITAFEVIEHLTNWRQMLSEAARLLSSGGTFLVSTPNKLYYADQRREVGPNPFHEHEFEFDEFKNALKEFFPTVDMLLQNRSEAFVFANAEGPVVDSRVRLESSKSDPSQAHFFLACCGTKKQEPFVFVPSTANLLRERELHIARLSNELRLKDQWLGDMTNQRDQLQKQHDGTLTQLEERNRWAQSLEVELEETRQRVVALQQEFAREQAAAGEVALGYQAKVSALEQDVSEKTNWARATEQRLSGELDLKCNELAEAVRLLDQAEATVEERTRWAQDLDGKLRTASGQLAMIRASRWVRLGRTAGIGPKVD